MILGGVPVLCGVTVMHKPGCALERPTEGDMFLKKVFTFYIKLCSSVWISIFNTMLELEPWNLKIRGKNNHIKEIAL